LSDAIAEYDEAVRLQPDYGEAHNNLGVVLAQMPGRLDDAIAQYEMALRLKPDSAQAHDNLGLALAQKPERLKDRSPSTKRRCGCSRTMPPGWHNLGAAWFHLGNLPAAAAAFREELRLSPTIPRPSRRWLWSSSKPKTIEKGLGAPRSGG